MATISAKLVKELREKTGAGMMDCKKALVATEGDMEKAFDWLREKGIAKSGKKAGRIAAEGLTAFVIDGNSAALVEVNSETDFVAKNVEFQELVKNIANLVVTNKPADVEAALALELDGKVLSEVIAEKTFKIGEKLSFRRFVVLEKNDDEVFGAYSHMGGSISSLVKLAGDDEAKAKDVAMHVAAQAPQYITSDEIPEDVRARELEVLTKQAEEENATAKKPKPANILERIIQGRLNKNFKEICLVDQAFIKDPNVTIAQYVGKNTVLEMVRYQVGEGMQHREDDFAAEVAAQAGM